MNIGILGGSFDPIHNGHLHMAKCAYESYALDQVWLIPAGHSPNKDEHGMTDAKDRFQMCKLAAQPYPWMTVSRLELDSAEKLHIPHHGEIVGAVSDASFLLYYGWRFSGLF
mgnify:CR=1 FL=1